MAWYLSKAMRQAANEASGINLFFEDPVLDADRVFYFTEAPRDAPKLQAKSFSKANNQTTLEAFKSY